MDRCCCMSLLLVLPVVVFPVCSGPAAELTESEYLSLPESELDVARAALMIARAIDPEVDVDGGVKEIDAIADGLGRVLKGIETPERIVGGVNRCLFKDLDWRYEPHRPFLADLLSGKQGDCCSFSCVYVAIGDRLGIPLFAVRGPRHVFIRYEGSRTINVETTSRGNVFTDKQVIDRLRIAQVSVELGAYLAPLTKRELVAIVLSNRGKLHFDNGRLEDALRDFEKAVSMYPLGPEMYNNRGVVYLELDRHVKALLDFGRAVILDPNYAGAYANRGIVYADRGEDEKAIRDYSRAIELNPDLGIIAYSGANLVSVLNA